MWELRMWELGHSNTCFRGERCACRPLWERAHPCISLWIVAATATTVPTMGWGSAIARRGGAVPPMPNRWAPVTPRRPICGGRALLVPGGNLGPTLLATLPLERRPPVPPPPIIPPAWRAAAPAVWPPPVPATAAGAAPLVLGVLPVPVPMMHVMTCFCLPTSCQRPTLYLCVCACL